MLLYLGEGFIDFIISDAILSRSLKAEKMKIALVAHDVAPSQMLAAVASVDGGAGPHQFLDYLDRGGIFLDPVSPHMLNGVDLLLIGMSSSPKLAREEIWAARLATEMGVPFGFASDIFGCFRRPWFTEFRTKAKFLFLPTDQEVSEGKKLFPSARVIASGNPYWETYFDPAQPSEKTREQLGFASEEKVILVSGDKILSLGLASFANVLNAAHLLERDAGKRWRVVLSLHPADTHNPHLYYDIAGFSKVPVKIVRDPDPKTHDLIEAADVVIPAAGSNIGIEAACMRKPVINYFDELQANQMEESIGSKVWSPCQMGISAQVLVDPSALAGKMLDLLVYGGYEREMRPRQEEFLPVMSDRGEAVKKICKAILAPISS